MQPDLEPIVPARVTFEGDVPVAADFGDGYFARGGGRAESELVFLRGNQLDARFALLQPGNVFVIGETGFGTGLNLMLAAERFARIAHPAARLCLVSAEKHPLPRAALARAHAAWPELAPWSARLRDGYPPPVPGFHRLSLAHNVDLVLMFGDAQEMWSRQPASVDAWFLDGFAPDRNPAMWQPALFELLTRRSRPGATAATFTVAGGVRRGLAQAGFEVRREPGFGRKRHRLEAATPGRWSPAAVRTGHATVFGAGLAGATTARALADRGWTVRVADAAGVAAGASGNRAGVVYTTPSGVATPQNRFYQASYLAALRWLRERGAEGRGLARLDGVVQHVTGARQRRKLESASASGHWPEPLLEWLDDDRVLIEGGGVVRPAAWCGHLLDHPRITFETARLAGLDADGQARASDGRLLEADATVLCLSAAVNGVAGMPALPMRRIRGQVTECRATPASRKWRRAHCHDGYLTPAIDGVHCVGATFDLHGESHEASADDDRVNLEQLRDHLPDRWRALGGERIEITGRRVGFRCQSPDFLPIAGPAPGAHDSRTWVNAAHGSRGITGTPLAAEAIADALAGLPRSADAAIVAALDPGRFVERAERRAKR